MVALGQVSWVGQVHHVAAPAEHRDRVAAGDAFAHRRQIGDHSVIFLGAAQSEAKSGDHLVEDQRDPVPVGEIAESLEKTRRRGKGALHGFDNDPSQLIGVCFDYFCGGFQIVPGADQDLLLDRARDARGVGHGAGEINGVARPLVAHQGVVVHAVEGPLELEALLASSERPGDAQGKERGLRAAVVEAHLFRAGHGVDNALGKFDGVFVDQ